MKVSKMKFIAVVVTLQLFAVVDAVKVDVTYDITHHDKMKFHTKDVTICERFNALTIRKDSTTVTCECKTGEIFFGLKGDKPACRHERSGHLYGCACTSTQCTGYLSRANVLLFQITYRGGKCEGNAAYGVGVWDGTTFHATSSDDFRMSLQTKVVSGTTYDNNLFLRWARPQPSYNIYEGRFLKFTFLCQGQTNVQFGCFVIKGSGTRTFEIEDHGGDFGNDKVTKEEDSKALEITIPISLAVVFIVLICSITYCCRKGYCGDTKRRERTTDTIQEPAVGYTNRSFTIAPSNLPNPPSYFNDDNTQSKSTSGSQVPSMYPDHNPYQNP